MTQSWSTLRASCLKSSTRFPEGSTAALSRVVLYCIMPTAATPSDVTRPTSFAKPWSVEIPMRNTNGPIDEYPCKGGELCPGGHSRGSSSGREERHLEARIQMSHAGRVEAVCSRPRVAEFRQLEIILTARLPEVGSTESTVQLVSQRRPVDKATLLQFGALPVAVVAPGLASG